MPQSGLNGRRRPATTTQARAEPQTLWRFTNGYLVGAVRFLGRMNRHSKFAYRAERYVSTKYSYPDWIAGRHRIPRTELAGFVSTAFFQFWVSATLSTYNATKRLRWLPNTQHYFRMTGPDTLENACGYRSEGTKCGMIQQQYDSATRRTYWRQTVFVAEGEKRNYGCPIKYIL